MQYNIFLFQVLQTFSFGHDMSSELCVINSIVTKQANDAVVPVFLKVEHHIASV